MNKPRTSRTFLLAAGLGLAAAMSLQGCFPLVATGVVTGTMVAVDRRTSGIVVEDNASELRISNRISKKYGDDAHVNVHSFNRIVLLTGEVRNDDVRKGVEEIATASENVRSVVNETAVLPTSSISDRLGDTALANRIRARYVAENKFPLNIVSTIVERHEVFLMGMVTQAEADQITAIASSTEGVARVVKVFEYIDASSIQPPAAQARPQSN